MAEYSATSKSVSEGERFKHLRIRSVNKRTSSLALRVSVSPGSDASCLASVSNASFNKSEPASTDDRLAAVDVVPDDEAIEVSAGSEEDAAFGGLGDAVGEADVFLGLVPA